MMKKYILGLFLALLLPLIHSCNSNNGDIGFLYGTWKLQQVTFNGENIDLSSDGTLLYTWSFQNSILLINRMLPYQEAQQTVASWDRDGTILTIDFSHSQANGHNDCYAPPEILGFHYGQSCVMTITHHSNSCLELTYNDNAGNIYTYSFKKTR